MQPLLLDAPSGVGDTHPRQMGGEMREESTMRDGNFLRVAARLALQCAVLNLGAIASLAEDRPSPERRDVAQIVRPLTEAWMRAKGAPGAIVVVRYEGRTYHFPFGLADIGRRRRVTPESIFELASVTKVFTTTSLAMEVEAGRMQLDASVARYAPYLEQHGHDIKHVTLEQLATHTSALPRVPTRQLSDRQWNKHLMMEWFAQWRETYPPGTRYLYSNIAMGLLGYAIENRQQRPLLEVWREQFLRPLDMRHTFFLIPPADRHLVVQGYGPNGRPVEHSIPGGWPAGGRLNSSGLDMGQFLVANLGERPELPAITAAMQFAQQPRFRVSEHMTLGLAWQRTHSQGELVIDKNGGLDGTSTYIGMLPERKIGVVVMFNRGKCLATTIGRKLLLAVAGKQHEGAEAPDEE